jgi:hypothetical protein
MAALYAILRHHRSARERLAVRSRPGRALFSVEVPATEPVPGNLLDRRQRAAPGRPRTARAGGGRRAHRDRLPEHPAREAGWRVDVSPGGRAAIERLRARGYDVIVSDIRMADGAEKSSIAR